MTQKPQISMDVLRTYIKERIAVQGETRIELDTFSDLKRFAFYLSIEMSRPRTKASYPQQRLSLERHIPGRGHQGVHLQIRYHKMDNPLKIGKMRVILEIENSTDLQQVAEGFLYTIYEVIGNLGDDLETARSKLFYEESILELKECKNIFIDRIRTSILERSIEIQRLDGEIVIIGQREIKGLISERKELTPIFGPVVENEM